MNRREAVLPVSGPHPVKELSACREEPKSLEGDGAAGLFDLSLGLLGVFLLGVLEDGRGRAVDEILGLLEAKTRDEASGVLLIWRSDEDWGVLVGVCVLCFLWGVLDGM